MEYIYIYIYQFQSIRTVMLSRFGSPLKTATVLCENVDDCPSPVLQGDTMVKDCCRMFTHEFHDYDLQLGSQSGFCCEYMQMDGIAFLLNCHMNKAMWINSTRCFTCLCDCFVGVLYYGSWFNGSWIYWFIGSVVSSVTGCSTLFVATVDCLREYNLKMCFVQQVAEVETKTQNRRFWFKTLAWLYVQFLIKVSLA